MSSLCKTFFCIYSISNDLQVIANEKLMSSAKMVGRSVQLSLQKLMDKWDNLLDDFFFLTKSFQA